MFKQIFAVILFVGLFCIIPLANAAMQATGNAAPLQSGENVLAAAVYNDSAGSSDLTLIIQLKADNQILVDEGSACKATVPLQNIPDDANPTGWTLPDFNDSSWQDAKYGVGYADNDDNTVIGDGQHAGVYTRARFTLSNPGAIAKLSLGVDYDDAAVVFINGIEVARTSGTGIPEKPEWDSWSDNGTGQSHEASKVDPPNYETVDLKFELASAVQSNGKTAILWGSLKK